MVPFINATTEKWNTKTRLASNQAEKSFKALNKSLVSQIEQILVDEDRVVKRTQMVRAPLAVIGKAPVPPVSPARLWLS